MSSEYVTIGTQLVGGPLATDAAADPGHPHDERVPPPGADGTLLAIVPIPGTQTSLAIVGYAISTAAAPRHAPAAPGKAPDAAPEHTAPGAAPERTARGAAPERTARGAARRHGRPGPDRHAGAGLGRPAHRPGAAPGLGRRRRDPADLPGVRAAGLPQRAPGHGLQPRGSRRSACGSHRKRQAGRTSSPAAARSTFTSAGCGASSARSTVSAWSPSTGPATSSGRSASVTDNGM